MPKASFASDSCSSWSYWIYLIRGHSSKTLTQTNAAQPHMLILTIFYQIPEFTSVWWAFQFGAVLRSVLGALCAQQELNCSLSRWHPSLWLQCLQTMGSSTELHSQGNRGFSASLETAPEGQPVPHEMCKQCEKPLPCPWRPVEIRAAAHKAEM